MISNNRHPSKGSNRLSEERTTNSFMSEHIYYKRRLMESVKLKRELAPIRSEEGKQRKVIYIRAKDCKFIVQ